MPHDDVDPTRPDFARPLAPATWRERLDELRRRWTPWQIAAGAVLAAGALVAAYAVLRPSTPAPAPELTLPRATTTVRPSGAPATSAATEVVVYAVGAFSRPGLYRLPPGSRVTDLVDAAGGLLPDADPLRINLAARLDDGARIVAARVGEPAPPPLAGAASDAAPAGPLDLNTATADQLDDLPGIGPATAQAIVAERDRAGPFASVDDLLRVRGIGPAKLEALRDLVTV